MQMMLNELGRLMGYHSKIDYKIDGDNKLDVAWFRDDTYNSPLRYAFEVHHSGSIDSAKTNLEAALSKWDNAQGILVVLNKAEENKVRKTVELMPYYIRKRTTVITECEKLNEVIKQVKKINRTLEEAGLRFNFISLW